MSRRGKVGGFGPAVWVWRLVSGPVDFRSGADRLLVHVREVLGREPLEGSAFVFRNRRGTRLKVLVVDAQGVWLAMRRLHRGRFVLPSTHESLCSLSRMQFAWLCAGVDWQRLSCDTSSLGKLV
ncbi:IS66 family insertion sequence element accessory protein TnpB [Rhodanobacter caeni]|uniref:Transposase n=1 Tax=Rhodanobacter caeni TaxID=657654 RepID=A0ABM6LEB7_9GAMM